MQEKRPHISKNSPPLRRKFSLRSNHNRLSRDSYFSYFSYLSYNSYPSDNERRNGLRKVKIGKEVSQQGGSRGLIGERLLRVALIYLTSLCMKTSYTLIFAIVSLTVGCSSTNSKRSYVVESSSNEVTPFELTEGVTTTKGKVRFQIPDVSGVTSLELSIASLEYTQGKQGEAASAVIEVDERLAPYVKYEKKGHKLSVSLDTDKKGSVSVGSKEFVLRLRTPYLEGISQSAGSNGIFKGSYTATHNLSVHLSSGASLKCPDLNLRNYTFTGELSSGADLRITDINASAVIVSASSGAGLKSDAATVGKMSLTATSGADMKMGGLNVDYLSATASSGAIMRFDGEAASAAFGGSSAAQINAENLRTVRYTSSISRTSGASFQRPSYGSSDDEAAGYGTSEVEYVSSHGQSGRFNNLRVDSNNNIIMSTSDGEPVKIQVTDDHLIVTTGGKSYKCRLSDGKWSKGTPQWIRDAYSSPRFIVYGDGVERPGNQSKPLIPTP